MKFKRTMLSASIISATLFLSGCDTAKEPQITPLIETAGSTLFYGGSVITMEEEKPRAEAVVASADGKIQFVGTQEEALQQYPQATKI